MATLTACNVHQEWRNMCRSAVRPEKQSDFKMVPMALFALLTVIGTHEPSSTHAPTCTHARADEPRHKHTHRHTNKCMQPPAQVVTLVFFGSAALIDLSMYQAKRDPPLALTFACERSIGGRIDDCPAVQLPHSTTALVRGSMVARSAYANFPAALRCVPRCRHSANMNTITATSDRKKP